MKTRQNIIITAVALFMLSFMSAAISLAATHVVSFGGSIGYAYSPDNFNCSVGDTVKWQGSFSAHPLSSTTIPAGAASMHASTGSVYIYKVEVAGTYHYICDFHAGSGMVGQFTAAATAVEGKTDQPGSYALEQNYPNPFNPMTTIRYSVPETQRVLLTVYNALGDKVATLADGYEAAGIHVKEFDGSMLPSGTYYYRLQAGSYSAVKKLTLVK